MPDALLIRERCWEEVDFCEVVGDFARVTLTSSTADITLVLQTDGDLCSGAAGVGVLEIMVADWTLDPGGVTSSLTFDWLAGHELISALDTSLGGLSIITQDELLPDVLGLEQLSGV